MKRLAALAISLLFVLPCYAQVMKRSASSLKPARNVYVYEEGKGAFSPCGWMGDAGSIKVDPNCTVSPKSKKFCMKWTYDCSKGGSNGWAGVYWLFPENNWGAKKGMDLTGHKRLSFWMRGDTGKEVISIKVGGIKGDYTDTFTRELPNLRLSSVWRQYSIDLNGRDLSNIIGGFCWTVDSKLNPGGCTFYLDEVVYE